MTTTPGDENRLHDWEHAKENVAPLACGRSVKSLSKRVFGTSAAEIEEVEKMTKKYERHTRRGENAAEWMQREAMEVAKRDGGEAGRDLTMDEAQELRDRLATELGFDPSMSDRKSVDYDPLRHWLLYIKHIQQNHPSDEQRQVLVVERCTRTFMARPFLVPQYQNDPRLVRVCIQYAEKRSNPSQMFKLMYKIKVGTKVSLFWAAWAWCAEKAEDFAFTEKIFRKALEVGAEPRKVLLNRQKHFLRRMSRHWLNMIQTQEESQLEDEDEGRGALNSISSSGVARDDRAGASRPMQRRPNGASQTSARSRPPQGRSRGNKLASSGFDIFQEESGSSPDDQFHDQQNNPIGRWRLVKESEQTKENTMRPEMWNERGYGLVNPSKAAASGMRTDSIVGTVRDPSPVFGEHQQPMLSIAAFDIFVDEEFVHDEGKAKDSACSRPSLRQQLDGVTSDRLTQDPKNVCAIDSCQVKYKPGPEDAIEASDRREDEKATQKQRSRAHMPESQEVRTGNGGCGMQHGKEDDFGDECCYEERRLAAGYYKLNLADDDFNLLKQEIIRQSSQMDVSVSMDVEESMDDVSMEEDSEEEDTQEAAAKPAKSALKSSLRNHSSARTKDAEAPTAATSPRRVLFDANVTVLNTHNTSISSPAHYGLGCPNETINTELAKAEIGMMFSSPGMGSW